MMDPPVLSHATTPCHTSTSPSLVELDQPNSPRQTLTNGASKRSKRYAPKVRTGCLTCKKRRVKCDETKPKCLKCLNSDYQCDGYAVPKAWLFEPKSNKTSFNPSSDSGRSNPEASSQALVLHPSPAPHVFTADENRSMHFYLKRSGRVISRYDHSHFDFWTQTMPQSSHRLDSVKHLLIATALQDELITSAQTVPKIERRIGYHYQQGLEKTARSQPNIEHILLNCMGLFYFDSLRSHTEAVVLHLVHARRIIDEWKQRDEKVSPDVHALIEMIDEIVSEGLIYSQCMPHPPSGRTIEWDKLPAADPYSSVEDAEHTLLAVISNLCKPVGQSPFALVRANVVLEQWKNDSKQLLATSESPAAHVSALMPLLAIAKAQISLLNQSAEVAQPDRWSIVLAALQALPKLRSVRYRKPVAAVIGLLQHTSQGEEQQEAIVAFQRHLQRSIMYDE